MKKTEKNLLLLNCLFVAGLLISNVIAGKIVTLGPLVLPAAIVAYPLTFLVADIINEIWGKEAAKAAIKNGLICQVAAIVIIVAAILIPPASFAAGFQAQFAAVLGQSLRVIIASLTAYFIAQMLDVAIFQRIREKTKGKKKWLRNNASTMVSQLADTAIFILLAFWGTVDSIWVMILSQYLVKFVYTILQTPFFYLFTRGEKEVQ